MTEQKNFSCEEKNIFFLFNRKFLSWSLKLFIRPPNRLSAPPRSVPPSQWYIYHSTRRFHRHSKENPYVANFAGEFCWGYAETKRYTKVFSKRLFRPLKSFESCLLHTKPVEVLILSKELEHSSVGLCTLAVGRRSRSLPPRSYIYRY